MKTGLKNGYVTVVICCFRLITDGLNRNRNTSWNVRCAARKRDIGNVECVHTVRWYGMDKRTIFLEVWRGSVGYAWTERQWTTIKAFKEEYDYNYVFMGKTATVFVGTEDYEMTREEALKIATDHVKGNVQVLNINLSTCGGLPERLRKNSTP